jgi:hypothetical protein
VDLDELVELIKQRVEKDVLGRSTDTHSMLHLATLAGSISSAQYFVEKMQRAAHFDNKATHTDYAMNSCSVDGLVLEFGVATGRSINYMAARTARKIYGFDVFTGLPETWRPGFEIGQLNVGGLPAVRDNVELVAGLFEDTLPHFADTHPGPIALLHIDCDLYNSTRTIFRYLGHKIVRGTVIMFDEYINYPGWQQHEFRAYQEYINWSKQEYEYIAVVCSHQQVAVCITS